MMNLAALWDLPICFFIENNGYAVSTTVREETRETRMSSRGGAYAIPALRVDGMDPVAVRMATRMALNVMRSGRGPTIIEAEVSGYFHHGGARQRIRAIGARKRRRRGASATRSHADGT